MPKLHRAISRILGAVMSSAVSIPALAADSPSDPQTAEHLEEILVTGSRVARSGFNAPTPTTVLSAEDLQTRGAGNVAEVLNEIPAFRPSQTPASAARGSNAGNYVDLRGLNTQGGQAANATTRTLVLVNGRRFVGSNTAGAVDLNLVPSSLIERTEVVTGGASAAWGSDAVAGVVNIILKDKLQGIESNIAYGQSAQSDYEEKQVSFGVGTAFAGDRGHVVFGAEYVDNEGVPDAYLSRDWGRQGYGQVTLGAVRGSLPSRFIAPDVRLSDRFAPGGVIIGTGASASLDNITFLGGQQTGTFVPGAIVGGNQMVGGGSNQGVYFTGGSNQINPLERHALMGRASFDVSDALGIWLEASRGGSEFNGFSASRRDDGGTAGASGALTIRQDNAFLPASIRQQMVNLGLPTISVGRVAYDAGYGFYPINTEQSADRVAAGLKGSFGEKWSWDAYYQWGQSDYSQYNLNTIHSNYYAAIDAVSVGGNIVCRTPAFASALPANQNPANADPGCVPFNIFGQNSPSAAAIDYVTGYLTNDLKLRQDAAAFNVNGEPFSNWAGPVSVAAGFEYRKEKADSVVDANSQADRFDINNPKPIHGTYNTKEVYAEVVVPLLKDKPAAQSLELNAAARYTDYSTSGSVETWKVGLVYYPLSELHFRATQSRDIRAPNIGELFSTAVSGRVQVTNPFNPAAGGGQVNQVTSGNPNLVPEKADTFTAGVVYQPGFLQGFRASLDYYDIKIDGAITALTAQQTLDACNAGNEAVCNKIVFTAPNRQAINLINVTQANFNSLKTNGVDLELAYDLPLGPGRFGVRALATYVDQLLITSQFTNINFVKQSMPQLAGNLRLSYDVGRVNMTAQARYIGPTVVDKTLIGPDNPGYSPTLPNSINDNTRPSVVYVNLSGQYRVFDNPDGYRLQLYAVINNLADKDPPPFGANNPIGASLYELAGRAYKAGVRFSF
jgi:iron complex outermembrane receptor protein